MKDQNPIKNQALFISWLITISIFICFVNFTLSINRTARWFATVWAKWAELIAT